MAVAQQPGKAASRFFCMGGTGLGKTHLLHAVGQHVVGGKKKQGVVCILESFNEYIAAIQENQLVKFKRNIVRRTCC